MKRFLYTCLVGLSMAGCRTTQPVSQSTPSASGQSVTFLHINDVYEITPLDNGKVGGMARVATVFRGLKKDNPNTYFFHAGDFVSPSVIGTLKSEGKTIRGRQMVDVMNAAGVQYVTFGNHEFDLDDEQPTNLQERINESAFDWVVANARQKQGGDFVPFAKQLGGQARPFPASVILQTPGGKIGVMAVTIPVNKPYVQITDPIEAARAEYERLKPQCDAVVALTHIDMVDDRRLAEALPGLALIMGGHDHDHMLERVGNVVIAKADANAKTAYIHRLRFDANKQLRVESELKAIDPSTPDDSLTQVVVNRWQQIADQSFKALGFDPTQVVTVAKEPWDGREAAVRRQATAMTDAIAQAMRAAYPTADVALFNGGSIRIDDVVRGNITQYDIVRMLPFGGGIQRVAMTGRLLNNLLHTGRLNKGRGGFLQMAGARYDEQTNTWLINDKPLQTDRDYEVAISDFLMTGKEFGLSYLTPANAGVKAVVKPDPTDPRTDIRKVLINYLRQ
ncbi:bifunctional metallophosphatase/5'-nucleotidase [Rudanella lutea]|uniref:bifunctional metallophosphatase/5'-nucleotidase n=1 Tax=Rudanella lutea TaxID=451374 RepID=UPI000371F95D|nr:bifunctional metallophosphatase/5'-nucleotidase [Rudanella lutea]